MRKLRIAVPVHESLVPPDTLEGHSDKAIAEWKTEFDVVATLRDMGHEVQPIGLSDELRPLRTLLLEWKPHIAFNLLEEFHNVAAYDQHVVSYLELMLQPYTGCNPRGMLLSRDKALSKKILLYHRIPTPRFAVLPRNRRHMSLKRLKYPLIVKSATEDASLTLAQASLVHDEQKLHERVEFVHDQAGTDALAEEYVEGRELYIGVIGNQRLQTFPVWEMDFGNVPEETARVATRKVKWDESYRTKYGIKSAAARDLPDGAANKIARMAKRIFRALHMTGYARMDLRLSPDGRLHVLEANANPELSYGDDFAESAESAGIGYRKLLQRIISLGLSYRAEWRG